MHSETPLVSLSQAASLFVNLNCRLSKMQAKHKSQASNLNLKAFLSQVCQLNLGSLGTLAEISKSTTSLLDKWWQMNQKPSENEQHTLKLFKLSHNSQHAHLNYSLSMMPLLPSLQKDQTWSIEFQKACVPGIWGLWRQHLNHSKSTMSLRTFGTSLRNALKKGQK